MSVSTILITILGALLTDKIVEPRLGEYTGPKLEVDPNSQLTPKERRGLKMAFVSIIIFVGVMLLMTIPENSILRLTASELK